MDSKHSCLILWSVLVAHALKIVTYWDLGQKGPVIPSWIFSGGSGIYPGSSDRTCAMRWPSEAENLFALIGDVSPNAPSPQHKPLVLTYGAFHSKSIAGSCSHEVERTVSRVSSTVQ